jgi:nucleoside-diphosphate-sugar epimerase
MVMDAIIGPDDLILVTGSAGFIGAKLVKTLLNYGFANLRCFARRSGNITRLHNVINAHPNSRIEIITGNLLSLEDCKNACRDVKVIFNLAAGVEKSFAGCFLNSVVTTRNILEETRKIKDFRRLLNVSSIAVYSGLNKKKGTVIDENSEVEKQSHLRFEGYTYSKIKQDEIVMDYNKRYGIPFVIVRPGVVFGPGKQHILGRVGLDTFGFFIHLGGSNAFPLTYVDNCADAILLAGLRKGIESEVFNIVDDDLPTCRDMFKLFRNNSIRTKSIFVPYKLFYLFSYLWEKYSIWSNGQLPPVFNRMRCEAYWKGFRFSNDKAKKMLGWEVKVSIGDAVNEYIKYLRSGEWVC